MRSHGGWHRFFFGIAAFSNAGRTWRVVYPDPVGTVVRVEVLATVLVEASAATHLHFDEKDEVYVGGERERGQGQVETDFQESKTVAIAENMRYYTLDC